MFPSAVREAPTPAVWKKQFRTVEVVPNFPGVRTMLPMTVWIGPTVPVQTRTLFCSDVAPSKSPLM